MGAGGAATSQQGRGWSANREGGCLKSFSSMAGTPLHGPMASMWEPGQDMAPLPVSGRLQLHMGVAPRLQKAPQAPVQVPAVRTTQHQAQEPQALERPPLQPVRRSKKLQLLVVELQGMEGSPMEMLLLEMSQLACKRPWTSWLSSSPEAVALTAEGSVLKFAVT